MANIENSNEVEFNPAGKCQACGAPLCLRKQLVNLALGSVESMSCLVCLGAQTGKSQAEVLTAIRPYILNRECFAKKWNQESQCLECENCICFTARELNLRGVACPINFVKTKLFLDKMQSGEVVKVLLDPGEPVESVTTSIRQEGHEILESIHMMNGVTNESQDQAPGANLSSLGFFRLTIRKA